jgi:purine-binding chemotaxis protein CheW
MMTAHTQDRPQGGDPDAIVSAESARGEQICVFVFRLRNSLYAIAAEKIEHVAPAMPPVRVPTAPESLLGIVHLRGRILTVVDLPAMLQLSGATATDQAENGLSSRLVATGVAGTPFAFHADEVLGIRDMPVEQGRSAPSATASSSGISNFFSREFDDERGVVSVLDLEAVLARFATQDKSRGPQQ